MYKISCVHSFLLTTQCVLKTLEKMRGILIAKSGPNLFVKYECDMSLTVKENIIRASKKSAMYGKKRPFIAKFDDFGRPLDDEARLKNLEGAVIRVLDFTEETDDKNYCYLELRGKIPKEEMPFTVFGYSDIYPGSIYPPTYIDIHGTTTTLEKKTQTTDL